MAHGICEGLWMKIIHDDLKVKYKGPIKLLCYNNSAISIAHNPIQHDRTKHIEIDKQFIKEKLNSGLLVIAHVPTGLQVVDVFTKGLPIIRFQEINGKCRVALGRDWSNMDSAESYLTRSWLSVDRRNRVRLLYSD
ncbi:Copia protein, partial [Mucuna pruriens]